MKKERKYLSGAEKIGILRRHLIEGVAISKVCEEAGIGPGQFYRWQQELFESGAEVLDGRRGRCRPGVSKEAERVVRLEAKLREKDEVLAELMGEYVALKKRMVKPEGRMGAARYAG